VTAIDFEFRSPVANFDDAESYRATAREVGAMVTSFTRAAAVHRRPGVSQGPL
jgi:hypothetical protein